MHAGVTARIRDSTNPWQHKLMTAGTDLGGIIRRRSGGGQNIVIWKGQEDYISSFIDKVMLVCHTIGSWDLQNETFDTMEPYQHQVR